MQHFVGFVNLPFFIFYFLTKDAEEFIHLSSASFQVMQVYRSLSQLKTFKCSVEFASELYVIKLGLELAIERRLSPVLVETDYLEAVNMLNGDKVCYATEGTKFED